MMDSIEVQSTGLILLALGVVVCVSDGAHCRRSCMSRFVAVALAAKSATVVASSSSMANHTAIGCIDEAVVHDRNPSQRTAVLQGANYNPHTTCVHRLYRRTCG